MASCYKPLGAIHHLWLEQVDGKLVERSRVEILKGGYNPESPPENLVHDDLHHDRYIPLPCGKCIGCRLQYSRQWADRCLLEAQYHKDNIFITLTYNNDNLPEKQQDSPVNPLVKSDLQKFFKDLRQYLWYEYTINHSRAKYFYDPKPGSKWRSNFKNTCPMAYQEYVENIPKIRYYACGEYSPLHSDGSGFRPHYHAIIFGYKPNDLKLFKKDIENNWLYFTSETIKKLWNKGFHLITDVTWETCAYTARYILKKQNGENASVYEDYNFPPEFTIMSRRPGIAHKFFEENPEVLEREFYIPTKEGHKTIRSNRYFDKCFDIYYPESYNDIKKDRIAASKINEELKSNLTTLSYKEQLAVDENHKLSQIKRLKRKEVFNETSS